MKPTDEMKAKIIERFTAGHSFEKIKAAFPLLDAEELRHVIVKHVEKENGKSGSKKDNRKISSRQTKREG